jgi:hypothetical protein
VAAGERQLIPEDIRQPKGKQTRHYRHNIVAAAALASRYIRVDRLRRLAAC